MCSTRLPEGALLVLLLLSFACTACLLSATSPGGGDQDVAIASDDPTCSGIGRSLLSRGGSAVDAAIAILLCVALYMPQSTGIGGGFFMTVYDRQSRSATAIDAREMAPLAAYQDMFHGNETVAQKGPLSIAVPGQIKGFHLAHQLYGRLPWHELFEPTIRLCREGFNVTANMAFVLNKSKNAVFADPGLRDTYVDPATGNVYTENDTVRMANLGDTLEAIAHEGPDAMYKGKIGQKLVDEIQEKGGILTADDFAKYEALRKDALVTNLSGGFTVFGVPPPACGIILSEILLVLDGYRFNRSCVEDPGAAVLTYHRIVEAFKYAYAKRAELGDDQFVDMSEVVQDLTSAEYASHIRSLIWDNQTFPPEHYNLTGYREDHGTSHLSLVSAEGDAVSVTSTINTYFGSGIMSPATGVILNDQMDDFSSPNITNYFGLPPSPTNYIVPAKRPVSSIAASVVVDDHGNVRLVTGAAGGSIIITATALAAMFNLWMEDNIEQATDRWRLHHQLYPPTVLYEQHFPKDVVQGLADIGHNVTESDTISRVNSVVRLSNGTLVAYNDPRNIADVR